MHIWVCFVWGFGTPKNGSFPSDRPSDPLPRARLDSFLCTVRARPGRRIGITASGLECLSPGESVFEGALLRDGQGKRLEPPKSSPAAPQVSDVSPAHSPLVKKSWSSFTCNQNGHKFSEFTYIRSPFAQLQAVWGAGSTCSTRFYSRVSRFCAKAEVRGASWQSREAKGLEMAQERDAVPLHL